MTLPELLRLRDVFRTRLPNSALILPIERDIASRLSREPPGTRVSPDKIRQARQLRASGKTLSSIAREIGSSLTTTHKIVTHKHPYKA